MIPYSKKKCIEVCTGEVKSGDKETLLVSHAIGSCVAVAALSKHPCFAALAHIMLPGISHGEPAPIRFRYATDALNELARQMSEAGVRNNAFTVCLAGGGNVLRQDEDIICQANITSITQLCRDLGWAISAHSLGGYERRCVCVYVSEQRVLCSVGDGDFTLLWSGSEDAFII